VVQPTEPSTTTTAAATSWFNNRQITTQNNQSAAAVDANTVAICRLCKALSPEEFLKMRERKEASQLAHLYAQPLACGRCQIQLATGGARWWSCGMCGLECRSPVHPQWTEKDSDKV
jgi:hypothetical protein